MIKKHVKKLLRRVSPAFDRRVRRFEKMYEEYAQKKIRIRTEEELETQSRVLAEARDVFDGLHLSYFLCGGALLGVIRDKDFIPWDWDVCFAVRTEDVWGGHEEILNALKKEGFVLKKENGHWLRYYIAAEKDGVTFEVMGFWPLFGKRYRGSYKFPAHLFDQRIPVRLRGQEYSTFCNPEVYLEWNYGDWQTPVRSCDKSVYLSPKAKTSALFKFITRRI